MITTLFLTSLLLKTILCCKQTCHLAFTGGSPNHPDVLRDRETVVPINYTGVITIEAAYIPNSLAEWEYIRFMQDQDTEPLVFQLHSPREYTSVLTIFGEDKIGIYPDSDLELHSLFDSMDANITIQVSNVHVATDNFYRVYLGNPGESHVRNYSYRTKENWEYLSFMRLNTTTQIKADNHLAYLKSVSACLNDVPELCGPDVEIVVVSQGEAYNLSCSVYGPPYLEVVWSNDTVGSNGRGAQPVLSVDGFLHTSTVYRENFDEDHSGEWKCFWKNLNLRTFSSTKVFQVVELVKTPSKTTFYVRKPGNQIFEWIIRTHNSEKYDTKLICEEEGLSTNNSYFIKYYTNSTLDEQHVTLSVTETVTSDKITCTLYLEENTQQNNTTILGKIDTTTFLREGYNCQSGYYGIGERCVKCKVNFTSPPRSLTCTPITRDSVLPESSSSRTWVVVLVAVVVFVILVAVLAGFTYRGFKLIVSRVFVGIGEYSMVDSSNRI